jgi:hypothetical protein
VRRFPRAVLAALKRLGATDIIFDTRRRKHDRVTFNHCGRRLVISLARSPSDRGAINAVINDTRRRMRLLTTGEEGQ